MAASKKEIAIHYLENINIYIQEIMDILVKEDREEKETQNKKVEKKTNEVILKLTEEVIKTGRKITYSEHVVISIIAKEIAEREYGCAK